MCRWGALVGRGWALQDSCGVDVHSATAWMPAFDVPGDIGGLRCCEVAHAAQVGLDARVGSLMADQVTTEGEPRPTLAAPMGPLPCVGPLMADLVSLPREGAVAVLALEGPLPRVGPLVINQVTPLREGVVAVLALKGLVPQVGGLMRLDVVLLIGRMLAEATVVPQHPIHPGGGLGGCVAVAHDGGAIRREGGCELAWNGGKGVKDEG